MSLKVWRAYRLNRKRDLWKFTADTYRLGAEQVKERVHKLFVEFMQGLRLDSEEYQEALTLYKGHDKRARAFVVEKLFREGYKKASVSMERSFFDFDVSLTFREYGKHLYLIPYCSSMMRNVLDFLDEDPRLSEYHYQNQTDKPERISDLEWARRAKVWHALTKEDRWPVYLSLEVSSYAAYHRFNPFYELTFMQSIYREEPQPSTVAELIRANSRPAPLGSSTQGPSPAAEEAAGRSQS